MDNQRFTNDYKAAFGKAAPLPIVFWHSDTPIAPPEPTNGCFFTAFEKIREGHAASFDAYTMRCGGGKFYCGLASMPERVPVFVSDKEHYKATPQLVKQSISQLNIKLSKYKYLNFQRIDKLDNEVDNHGLLILATPDILSGLVSWAYYDNDTDNAVCTPWGSGCSATIRATIQENERHGKRCFIGLFDPSVRSKVRSNELMFAIPRDRAKEMATFLHDTCLFHGAAWTKVKQRITSDHP